MNPCENCITFPICRNNILQFIKNYETRNGVKISNIEARRVNFNPFRSLVHDAYNSCIEPKCKLILHELENLHILHYTIKMKYICHWLNIKKEHI